MSDLTTRLRRIQAERWKPTPLAVLIPVAQEAADRIEADAKEIERLRGLLRECREFGYFSGVNIKARIDAALEGTTDQPSPARDIKPTYSEPFKRGVAEELDGFGEALKKARRATDPTPAGDTNTGP